MDDLRGAHLTDPTTDTGDEGPEALALVARATDGRLVDADAAAERITGFGRDELLAMRLDDLISTDTPRGGGDCAPLGSHFGPCLRRKDGRMLPIELAGWTLAEGRLRVVLRDVSAPRAAVSAARAALRESETEMRALLGAMTDLIFVIDRRGRHLRVGPTSPELLYRPAAEVIGRSLHEVFEAPLADRALEAVRRALASARPVTFDYDLLIQDERRWFTSIVSPMDDERVLWVARDVTKAHVAEAALRASESRYRLLFDANPLAMMLVDEATLAILEVNDASARQYGWTREEFAGLSLRELRAAGEGAGMDGSLLAVADQQRVAGIHLHRRRDGTTFPVEVVAYRLTIGGRAMRLAMATDVTERVHLETQLRHAQKLEAVGRLAGGIAHDFNNLLTAIISHDELLLEQFPRGHPGHEDLREIRDVALRAAALTRQLLAFSRRQLLQPRTLDLGEVMRGTESLLRRMIGEDVRLLADAPGTDWLVRADPGQVEQVLMNLAVNARDAMPDGGALEFRVEARLLDAATAAGFADAVPGDYVVLVVRDTGVGMSDATRARLFEPFFTTKEPGKGTGLGLATVYGIVRQSGGFIDVESAPGQGTTFRIHLPRWSGPGDDAVVAAPSAARRGGGETVLLVEDEEIVRTVSVRVLRGNGYRVIEARNGREGLAVLQSGDPPIDLVLTDYVMPEMGGAELVERAAHLSSVAAHPPAFVFMSGYTGDALAARGEAPAGVLFLEKPFAIEQLLAAVRRALDGRASGPVVGNI